MSTGGVFILLNNRGQQDRLLMQTDKLIARLKSIAHERKRYMQELYPNATDRDILTRTEGWAPTLTEIEKTHILFVNASFKPFVAITHEYMKVSPSSSTLKLGNTLKFTLPLIGDFINDAVMYIRLENLTAVETNDKVRYTEFLGHRLCEHVELKLQEFVLDEYGSDEQNAFWNFHVPVNKEIGYLRNIGQEQPELGYLITNPLTDNIREYKWYGNGPQTYKQTHASVEMWVPMLFWNRDIQSSMPNVLLPQSQTSITVKLAAEEDLIAFTNFATGEHTSPVIAECAMYVNQIFILPEVLHVYITRFGFQLVRVHRRHRAALTQTSANIHLNQIKWPVETLYIGFRPQANLLNSAYWHRNSHIVETSVATPVVISPVTLAVNQAVFTTEVPVVRALGLKAHGITLYSDTIPSFYNSYTPFRYGQHLKTPKDSGWYMINFGQFPGEYQPSGHLNTSRSRELYLNYVSAIDAATGLPFIQRSTPVDLIVLARCINFIIYDQGNATMRYLT